MSAPPPAIARRDRGGSSSRQIGRPRLCVGGCQVFVQVLRRCCEPASAAVGRTERSEPVRPVCGGLGVDCAGRAPAVKPPRRGRLSSLALVTTGSPATRELRRGKPAARGWRSVSVESSEGGVFVVFDSCTTRRSPPARPRCSERLARPCGQGAKRHCRRAAVGAARCCGGGLPSGGCAGAAC